MKPRLLPPSRRPGRQRTPEDGRRPIETPEDLSITVALAHRAALNNASDQEFCAMLRLLSNRTGHDLVTMTLQECIARIERNIPRVIAPEGA